jgi:hypothetical protein
MSIFSGFGSVLFVNYYWWYKKGAFTPTHYDPKASFYPIIVVIELFIVTVIFLIGLVVLKIKNKN